MKDTVKDTIVKFVKEFDIGRIMYNRILQPLSIVISGLTFLKVYNISLSFVQMLLFALLFFSIIYLMGYTWVKLGFYSKDLGYDVNHNKALKELINRKI